jgi:hypothetical protein
MISPDIHVRDAHESDVRQPAPLDDAAMSPSYNALRVGDGGALAEWWAEAHARKAHAPTAIRAILAGRTRIELTAQEAASAIDWASRLPGWESDGPAPLFVYVP